MATPLQTFALNREKDLTGFGMIASPELGFPVPGQQPPMGQPAPPSVPSGGDTSPAWLTQAESGGRWDARNDAVGSSGRVGHFGRIQFGLDRLDDAKRAGVIPPDMTPQQFMQDPETQRRAETWHWSDIDKAVYDRGLSKYLGTSVNGVRMDLNAMRSIAHLGGKDGLERYLKTGGAYNPKDVNGVSLADRSAASAGGGDVTRSTRGRGGLEASTGSEDLEELMPDMSPEEQKRLAIASMLQGLGVGLSQMSQGKTVDLSDVFKQYQLRQVAMRERMSELTNERRRRVERGENLEIEDRYRQEDKAYQTLDREDAQAFNLEFQGLDHSQQTALQNDAQAYERTIELWRRGWSLDDQQRMRGWTVADAVREREEKVLDDLRERGYTEQDLQTMQDQTLEQMYLQADLTEQGKDSDVARATAETDRRKAEISEALKGTQFESQADMLSAVSPNVAEQYITTVLGKEFEFGKMEDAEAKQKGERRRVADIVYKDNPDKDTLTELFVTDPSMGEAMETRLHDRQVEAAKLARQEAGRESIASIYQDLSPEAANLARGGEFEAAHELYRKLAGEDNTPDIINYEYLKELSPEDALEFLRMSATRAGIQDPHVAAAMGIEETRLAKDAEGIAKLRQTQSMLGSALDVLSDPDFETGPASAAGITVRKLAKQVFGVEFGENLSQQEYFEGIANRMVSLSREVGEGSMSDFDAERILKSTIGLGKSREANIALAYAYKRMAEKKEATYYAEVEFLAKGGGDNAEREAFINEHIGEDLARDDTFLDVTPETSVDDVLKLPLGTPYFLTNEDGTRELVVAGEE